MTHLPQLFYVQSQAHISKSHINASFIGFKYHFIVSLPEFLYGSLLLPFSNHQSRVVDGEEEDVPVAAEPGDEERTGERLEGQLYHLSGTHPGGGDAQHQQQTPQHL